jgi:predicted NAD/FAD-dependent oxidoreductase
LVHGELHNNLRMTWAKAIPHWTETPERALAELIDLNHRHALDGSDPNSYGGLLWTLGLFDRPFQPERPVVGALRPRRTEDHAQRLDLDAYARRVAAPASGPRLSVAVIGAGLAGIAAARTLADQGHHVILFEKSRGRGGRAATRRIPLASEGEVSVDHGAQYFTARDPRFRRRVQSWAQRGGVAGWDGRFGAVTGGGIESVGRGEVRWVGMPGMSGIGGVLAEGLDLRLSCRVGPPRRSEDGWLLADDTGATLGRFDRVLIAAPAPQATALLAAMPALAARAEAVRFAPCWTVLLGFTAAVGLPWDGLFLDSGPLGWAARNGSKPGRSGEVWVLHGAPDWSRAHLDDPPEAVGEALLAAFRDIAGGPLPPVRWRQVHRWRYARAEQPLRCDCLWDQTLGIGACGDWCGDGRIEGAWLSGEALAGRVLAGGTPR